MNIDLVRLTSNLVEGLQTELDGVNHVLVEECVFRRGVASADLAFLSGHAVGVVSLPDRNKLQRSGAVGRIRP
jgi:hypothetical protein